MENKTRGVKQAFALVALQTLLLAAAGGYALAG
jgi:hypothetical protein